MVSVAASGIILWICDPIFVLYALEQPEMLRSHNYKYSNVNFSMRPLYVDFLLEQTLQFVRRAVFTAEKTVNYMQKILDIFYLLISILSMFKLDSFDQIWVNKKTIYM